MTATAATARANRLGAAPIPADLVLTPVSRRPTTLPEESILAILAAPVRGLPARQVTDPRASVVIATADSLVFLKLCLTSLLTETAAPAYEVLVVDNGSTDGTAGYLNELSGACPQVRVIRNDSNLGFAPATNQGLEAARGEVLVLLNDDTVVPAGWLEGLCRHLEDPRAGLIGPETNRAGNDSQIDVSYDTYGEVLRFAADRATTCRGETRELPSLTMFCLALRRDTFDRLGSLDEQFVVGMFEDDDYAMRARAEGYRIICAADVFVHHFGATSLGRLAATGEFGSVFDANRRRFEKKWNVTWTPPRRRVSAAYQRVVDDAHAIVGREVRPGEVVAILSRGDNLLVELPDRVGWHFPRLEDGTYAGYHPASSNEAIQHLEAVRERGARYLLVPRTARWWLEHYEQFRQHLGARHRLIVDDDRGVLFALSGEGIEKRKPAARAELGGA